MNSTKANIMKKFWPEKIIIKNRKYYQKKVNIAFLVLIVLSFSVFAFYQKLTGLLFSENKIDVFTQDLESIAFYFRNFDQDLSKMILKMDDVVQGFIAGENILKTKEKEIDEAREYMKKNKTYLNKLWFSNYQNLMDFLWELHSHTEVVYNLLGREQQYNYLIVLQNTNEKRPNGGFFGSFAFVSFSGGHIQEFEIVDSYYPDFIAYRTAIDAPERSSPFLPERKIWFLTSNKFGFTDIDGKNIKLLYEKSFNENYVQRKVDQTFNTELKDVLFHKDIKWVIFIRSDAMEELIPWFTKKIQERQFVNASIDIIRQEELGNKKELYIKEVKDYFDKYKTTIFKNFVNNFDTRTQKNYIQIYLSNVPQSFDQFLIDNHFNNTFNNKNIYTRDTNTSYNKVDGFVTKTNQITNNKWIIISETQNDIIDIQWLQSGDYQLQITYTLNVPQNYTNFIKELEQKYKITIQEREQSILAIRPAKYTDDAEEKRRETKATIYFPLQMTINKIQWDLFKSDYFQTPFANGIYYKSKILNNNTTNTIKINFTVN